MCSSLTRCGVRFTVAIFGVAAISASAITAAGAQPAGSTIQAPTSVPAANAARPSVEVPAEYVIGPEDVLGINFWRDTDMTGDVTVRPDGRITLPLIGDISAIGLTPGALKEQITKVAAKLIEDPSVTVVVRAINSRKVFITGEVTTPNAYPLSRELTVMQLITLAGGLSEYADKKKITILRTESGKQQVFKFNYQDVSKGKNLAQNIVLKPGDTVVVP
jgi:polysaccharide export outer membrane protein